MVERTAIHLCIIFSFFFTVPILGAAQWFPLNFPVMASPATNVLDLSALNSKPAGANGFIRVKNSHFANDQGRIRFVGVALVYGFCYPEKEDAPKIAAHFARNGVNLVRLHFFMNNLRSTNAVKVAEDFDRLDFFMASLVREGIYINLDLYDLFGVVDKEFRLEGVTYRNNDFLYFSKCLEAQKKYSTMLFTHVNPYLGRAYKDEPGIALTELVNENSFFWNDGLEKAQGPLKDELEDLFVTWATTQKMNAAGILKDTSIGLVKGNLTFRSVNDHPVMKAFAVHLLERYYETMMTHLRTLGVRIPVTGHNAPFFSGDLYPLRKTDYICGHFYWTHSDLSAFKSPLNHFWDFPPQMTRSRVKGMPLIYNEFSFSHPNRYRSEGLAELIAYANLHDLDALVFFSYLDDWPSEKDAAGKKIPNSWKNPAKKILYHSNLVKDGSIWPLLPTFALAFRRGDVAPSRHEFSFKVPPSFPSQMEPREGRYDMTDWQKDKDRYVYRQALAATPALYSNLPALFRYYEKSDLFQLLAGTSRIAWDFSGSSKSVPTLTEDVRKASYTVSRYALSYLPGNDTFLEQYQKLSVDLKAKQVELPEIRDSVLRSDTGEIKRNFAKGVLSVETKRLVTLSGFIKGKISLLDNNVSWQLENEHATTVLISLDGKPLRECSEALLAFGMNSENTEQKSSDKDWNIGQTYDAGVPPILCESPKGKFSWKRPGRPRILAENPSTGIFEPTDLIPDSGDNSWTLLPGILRYRIIF